MNKTRLSAFRWEDTNLNAHLRSVCLRGSFIPVCSLTGAAAAGLTSERLLESLSGRVRLGNKLVVDEVQCSRHNRRLRIGDERTHNAGRETPARPTTTAPGTSSHQCRHRSRRQHNGADISGCRQRGERGHQGRRGQYIRIEVLLVR